MQILSVILLLQDSFSCVNKIISCDGVTVTPQGPFFFTYIQTGMTHSTNQIQNQSEVNLAVQINKGNSDRMSKEIKISLDPGRELN